MRDLFEELAAKVAQNVVDRKHDEIKWKNPLIANDNLIAKCFSKEEFYVATTSKLNVARFTEMHVANTVVEERCLEHEAELSTLRDKSHNDNHNELVNWFSNLKVVRPLDSSIVSACRYTKHSQELLEYAIVQCDTSNSNTHKHVAKLNTQKTNVHVPPSTGVNCCTDASGSQPRSNTKKNRISSAKGVNKMQVKEQPRTNKSHLRTTNRVDSSSRSL
uniref:Uncharacterized protein n=1 Tax=Tanacetum cinerariifolium TaxID=118510 RepID=A0A699INQ9_TANCI|nr:hypothetical protein [Tanacetum cinerariifolium]